MSTSTRNFTADELLNLPSGRHRYELVRGELHTMSPSGGEHSVVAIRLGARIEQFVSSQNLGIVFGAECGFRLEADPDTVLAPDVAFVRQERVPPAGPPQGFWPGAPDLAVEVASPGDSKRELDEKAAAWLRAGTHEVWVVMPRKRCVTVYAPDNSRRTFASQELLDGGTVLPGFSCRVGDLFWSA